MSADPAEGGVILTNGARRFPLTCDAAVTRKGELEPCGKPAVTWGDPAVFADSGWGGMRPWPICAYHAHMGKALPLDQHPGDGRTHDHC